LLDTEFVLGNKENEIAYEVWRAEQCKGIIAENRKLRFPELANVPKSYTELDIISKIFV
jgi:hypothetical protein